MALNALVHSLLPQSEKCWTKGLSEQCTVVY